MNPRWKKIKVMLNGVDISDQIKFIRYGRNHNRPTKIQLLKSMGVEPVYGASSDYPIAVKITEESNVCDTKRIQLEQFVKTIHINEWISAKN